MPGSSSRIVCYCKSCRAFVESLGAGRILDDAGGNDLLQTAPDAFQFTQGQDLLTWTKVTEKGPMRWFTMCCNTPVANTLGSPAVPFLSLQTAYFEAPERTGKIMARVNKKGATGHIEGDMGSTWRMLWEFIARALRSRLTGGYKKNPFFDAQGHRIAARVTVPSDQSETSG
ncbi:MAG: hypothetical protein HKN27_08450 [Silicimonas sp.]|nr:hypothetical protein [Silicimonas sp.]